MRQARQAGGRRSGSRRLVPRGWVAADRGDRRRCTYLKENISKDTRTRGVAGVASRRALPNTNIHHKHVTAHYTGAAGQPDSSGQTIHEHILTDTTQSLTSRGDLQRHQRYSDTTSPPPVSWHVQREQRDTLSPCRAVAPRQGHSRLSGMRGVMARWNAAAIRWRGRSVLRLTASTGMA